MPTRRLVLVCLSCVGCVTAEVFSAMEDMQHLLSAERTVKDGVDQYIAMEMQRLERLKVFADEYQSRNQAALHEGAAYIGNPVNAFLLIKRLKSDWSHVESLMKNNIADDFLLNITSRRAMNFPTKEDLEGAATALFRLQDTYQLDTTDIASGRLLNAPPADIFTAHDCFEMGRTSYHQDDYYHAVMWMQEGLDRFRKEAEKPTVHEAELLEYLAFSLYKQGNVKRALVMTKRLHELVPDHASAAENIDWYEQMLAEAGGDSHNAETNLPPVVNKRPSNGKNATDRQLYEDLCRSAVIQPTKPTTVSSDITCYYKRDHPYLRWAPIKVEVLRLNPLAVLFKEIVSETEIAMIKELAIPKLKRAAVKRPDGKLLIVDNRVAKNAWLSLSQYSLVKRINDRIERMTNLDLESGKDLQALIANYGIGGHYEPHWDMSTRVGEIDPIRTGNCVATVLFYLQAPEAGGATVFPDLNVAVSPIQGDALFWYNLNRDGTGDLLTRHAACPVLVGVKWVANKWIHERGNEFHRPCAIRESINEQFVGQL